MPKLAAYLPTIALVLALAAAAATPAAAQTPDDEYYPYAGREERRALLTTDSLLFYRAVQTAQDLYGEATDFTLPGIAAYRRGFDYDAERMTLSGIELSYRNLTTLRLLGAEERFHAGLTPIEGSTGGVAGERTFRFGDDEPLQPAYLSARFADRNYRFGARAGLRGRMSERWDYAVALDARTGSDMHVAGVFTQAVTPGLRLTHRLSPDHRLSLTAVVPLSIRGTRLSSSAEAFTLTGDRLYNPAWGYQSGRVRNSRVRRESVPMGVVSYEGRLSDATTLSVSAGFEGGTEKYSQLDWYDARTPMPDNYRYLPGYTGDRESLEAWLAGDPRYTQIDWDELIRQNRMAGGEAVYALADRVTRLTRFDARALVATRLGPRLTVRVGGRFGYTRTRSYKQMRDLLGAHYVTDIDQYLIDDDTYGTLLQNDLRHPDRRIGPGDRFGYEYALTQRRATLLLQAEYRSDRLRVDVSADVGDATVQRRGYYEKELFPGGLSYGASRRLRFTPYGVKATVGWAFTTWQYVEASVLAASRAPAAEALFYQPQYNNRTVERPTCERTYAAEVGYRRTGEVLSLQATLYATVTLDGMQTRRYYDDMASVFSDLAITGIGLFRGGVEAGAAIRLSYRWRLTVAASANRYRYIRNPRVTALSDVDNSAVDVGAVSRMGGCVPGGSPQLTASAEGSWFGPKGWGLSASAGYAGLRYVEPMPLRRTDRIASQAGITPEAFASFTEQERLDDALTVDLSLFKSFYFARSRMTVSVLLRNLTGNMAVYNGYESMRVRRLTAGDATYYAPHATRYTYTWPRTFYVTVSYRF